MSKRKSKALIEPSELLQGLQPFPCWDMMGDYMEFEYSYSLSNLSKLFRRLTTQRRNMIFISIDAKGRRSFTIPKEDKAKIVKEK
jgi:hypothetical protein